MSEKRTVNALENCRSVRGCFFKNNELTPAYALASVNASLPSGTQYLAYSDAVGKYCACSTRSIYISEDGEQYTAKCNVATYAPYMLEDCDGGEPRAVFITGQVAVPCTATESSVAVITKIFDSAVVHCGRVFGANGLNLRWSGDGGWNDWKEGINESGSLVLDPSRGNILDLKVFAGKLVAVREYGITSLSMYGSPENFSVDITDTDCDRIYSHTACVVGDRLYFYSASGLKSFDGSKIDAHALRHTVTDAVCAGAYAGKYFLACQSGAEKAVLCVDTQDFESCLSGDAADFVFIKDGVYFIVNGALKKLVGGGTYSFESGEIDFGTSRAKTLVKMEIFGRADVYVTCDGHVRKYANASGVVRPHMRGKSFSVKVEGGEKVKSVLLTAEVTRAV